MSDFSMLQSVSFPPSPPTHPLSHAAVIVFAPFPGQEMPFLTLSCAPHRTSSVWITYRKTSSNTCSARSTMERVSYTQVGFTDGHRRRRRRSVADIVSSSFHQSS